MLKVFIITRQKLTAFNIPIRCCADLPFVILKNVRYLGYKRDDIIWCECPPRRNSQQSNIPWNLLKYPEYIRHLTLTFVKREILSNRCNCAESNLRLIVMFVGDKIIILKLIIPVFLCRRTFQCQHKYTPA